MMKYIFILNAHGSYNILNEYERIRTICDSMLLDYKIEVNDTVSTDKILEKYRGNHDVIYAVGGGGMINRVVNGIVGTNNYFAYIPKGTGNDFDRTIKKLDLENVIKGIDLVKINDRYFINVACFGIDAKIANDDRFIRNKMIPASMRYNASVISNFLTYKPVRFEIETSGYKSKRNFTTVVAANGMYYGGGYMVSPFSKLDNGMISLYMVDDVPRLKMAKLILEMKDGKHICYPEVHMINTNKVTIRANQLVEANIDGEKLCSDVFEIEMAKEKVKLYNDRILRKILSN